MDSENSAGFLSRQGLVCCSFSVSALPVEIQKALTAIECDVLSSDNLVLLANAGPVFWRVMKAAGSDSEDQPVDDFSRELATHFAAKFLNETTPVLLYPSTHAVPLIKLGELAGWSTPSPLGLGMHSVYGPWFAYRALIKTAKSVGHLPQPATSIVESPCITCLDTPCVKTCPAKAVRLDSEFNLSACHAFRKQNASPCIENCLSRQSCPVGTEYRYDADQLAHHMRRSLS